MGKGLAGAWVQDISSKDLAAKDNRVATVLQSMPGLEVLKNIIDRELARVEREEQDFDNPAWPYKAASLVGEKKALHMIKKLIPSQTFVEDKLKEL